MEEFVLNHLDSYDVLCIQESIGLLWEVKDKLIAACKKAGYFFIADSVRPGLFSS